MECSELFYNFIFIDFFDKHIHKDEEDLKERSTQKKEKGIVHTSSLRIITKTSDFGFMILTHSKI